MKKITIIFLILCTMQVKSQVKIVPGGNVWISSPFNPANYTTIGKSIRIYDSKLGVSGYFSTALAVDHVAATTPNPNDAYKPFPIPYQWSTIVSVDNLYTKSWIVDAKSKNPFGVNLHSHNFMVFVSGEVWSKMAFVNFSDSNFKFDVQPITGALSKIQNLNGVYYRIKPSYMGVTLDSSNQDSFHIQKRQIGFLAQQVEPILPEVVFKGGPDSSLIDSTKGVNYAAMVALLVEGIKEQQMQIDFMQTQIDALQNQLNLCCPQEGIISPNDKKRRVT